MFALLHIHISNQKLVHGGPFPASNGEIFTGKSLKSAVGNSPHIITHWLCLFTCVVSQKKGTQKVGV